MRVTVVTNSLAATDVLAVHGGYARHRRRLLRAGVELRELKRGGQEGASLLGSGGNASLHTKAFCVDGELAFVGSFNFDPRSAHLNTEMGVFVRDAAVAGRLAGGNRPPHRPGPELGRAPRRRRAPGMERRRRAEARCTASRKPP